MNEFSLQKDYGAFKLDASARWEAGRMALFGASGSGKTTVVEALAGVRPEVQGKVVLGGQSLDGIPARDRRVAWVPQEAMLFPHLDVGENVRFAFKERERCDTEGARLAMEALEISELATRRPSELSGGEKQRVAIARALASRPRFLVLDEPTASIDRPLRARVLPFLRELPERLGLPFLFVSHDPLEVLALADHVAVMERGKVVQEGSPASVFASPANLGALFATAAENRFDVRVVGRNVGTLTLETPKGTRLSAVHQRGFPEPGRIAVRAEDIVLAVDDPGRVSAQNILGGRVIDLVALGEQRVVQIDVEGEIWRTKVTEGAVKNLVLEPGRNVVLLVKAHAILPIP